ncbi:MAG TPA: chorismate-binding protein, partial [Flavobacterium sp.]|nr:chorismate-binding protein [Flavobacterium sp.]
PFEGAEVILIPENLSEVGITDFEPHSNPKSDFKAQKSEDSKARKHFESLIQKGLDAINNGDFDKVVLSRKEEVSLTNFDFISVFEKLLNEYPTAFAYCFFHPKTGLWFGAFSEQLLKVQGNVFHTMAVAGTQPISGNIVWAAKEQQEQLFVTDFILESLRGIVTEVSVSEPYSMKAGNVVHIKTDIKGILNSGSDMKEIIQILNPTPAVCGLPKEAAKKFIFKNEGYDRGYYSGFFGELNTNFETSENHTDLYVNLRCMQIEQSHAVLYIGCGITKDSIPQKEWQETVNKSMTMKQILMGSN